MTRAVSPVSLLVFALAWTLQGIHISPETLPLSQDDFDLGRFMGRWYEVAVVSTCPHYMQNKRRNPVIAALELTHVASEPNFTMTATSYRNGSCKQTFTVYSLTDHPGHFFHHVARFGADVYSHVVHTNYDEYAMMLLLSTEKPTGNKTTLIRLFSRTMDVSPVVLDNFKATVKQHRMSDDNIIMNQNKGECVPDQHVSDPNTQVSVPK
ncbi:hypothetical protein Q5P01_024595 [Channa striata]|uniref:Lipocalin/cytosolic fatty-acid binding domain-containing protein n=1 Tax=Channa striata TaxID=64152 RepID=A0AA88IU11_CHASR|nr:hypothetical protein Q5P01_024595 [Channa striata]